MSAAALAPAFDAPALLESLRGRGAEVSIRGTDAGAWLHVAPRGILSDDERADFRRYKRELLAAFDAPDDAPAHRWASATGDDPTGPAMAAATPTAPDARALAVAVAGATVGAFIRPTPELLALWRALSAFARVPLTSRHIGALARLVAQHPQLDNTELLDLFGAGLMPDEGDGAPVWIEPQTLFDAMHATAKARARQTKLK